MIYGYARVSAKTQLKGNSLDEQRAELKRNGCEVIVEEQFTGKTTARPKFEDLIKILRADDTLVVCNASRLATQRLMDPSAKYRFQSGQLSC